MIQINTCTQDDIERLPGIGPATAQKLIEARPIQDVAQLEELIPPSAWLKVQGVEFGFEVPGNEPVTAIEEIKAVLPGFLTPLEPAITMLQEPQPFTMRRVMPGQQLKQGAKYLCPWNMRWGPAGEAVTPQDAAIQIEVETRLKKWDISVMFAHYAASVRVGTDSYGQVPVLFFEIIEETQDAETENTAGADQGNG